MARSPRSIASAAPLGPLALTRSRSEVAAQLQDRIDRGREILARMNNWQEMASARDDLVKWRDYNFELLKRLFTTEEIYNEYRSSSHVRRVAYDEREAIQVQLETAEPQIQKLGSILERLELYPEPATAPVEATSSRPRVDSRSVFVVHGHDEAALQAIARFLETIGLQAIVLREQPDRGRTIIEKFEACANEVGFAIALLTPDDLGGSMAVPEQATRGRQNVIFELGYFVGSLGRGRACLIRKGDVEIPSDLFGVIYTDFDHPAEGWKVKLARELKAAGFKFDADKVLA
jgi:predicted nucleotide-binding protein